MSADREKDPPNDEDAEDEEANEGDEPLIGTLLDELCTCAGVETGSSELVATEATESDRGRSDIEGLVASIRDPDLLDQFIRHEMEEPIRFLRQQIPLIRSWTDERIWRMVTEAMEDNKSGGLAPNPLSSPAKGEYEPADPRRKRRPSGLTYKKRKKRGIVSFWIEECAIRCWASYRSCICVR